MFKVVSLSRLRPKDSKFQSMVLATRLVFVNFAKVLLLFPLVNVVLKSTTGRFHTKALLADRVVSMQFCPELVINLTG